MTWGMLIAALVALCGGLLFWDGLEREKFTPMAVGLLVMIAAGICLGNML